MVSGSYPPIKDGVGDYTFRLVDELKRLGKGEVKLVTTETELSVLRSDVGVSTVPGWGFAGFARLLKLLRETRPDIVHVQYPALGYGRSPWISFLPMYLRFFSPRTRVVTTVHEFSDLAHRAKPRVLLPAALSHRVIIVTAEYAAEMGRFWPPIRRKLISIPVGSNVLPPPTAADGEAAELRDELGLPREAPLICYFGVIRPRKGVEVLLAAFRETLRRVPGARLLIVGHIKDPYYDSVVRPLVTELGVSEAVVFTGSCPVEQVSRYLALADLCVLPFEDGVTAKRSSFACAIQHGLPTITTRSAYLPEGLVDRGNVLLVEPGDVQGLAEAMVELLEDEKLREKLFRGADELAKQFAWENIARQTWDVYLALQRGRSRA